MPIRPRTEPAAPESERFTVGTQRYCAVRRLGTSGVGEQILARSETPGATGQLVLLKRLRGTRPEDRRRFLEEARLLRMLHHPGIPRVLAVAPRAQLPLMVMEYVEGLSLERVLNRAIRRHQPVSAPFAAYVAARVADALDAAHSLADDSGRPLQLVHRAVSPRNIHLSARGEVKLTDFDAAFTVRPGRPLTRGMRVKGELAYAAPEVLRHEEPGPRADVFSLGLVLMELLTNQYLLDSPLACKAPRLTGRLAQLAHRLKPEEPSWAPPAELAALAESLHPGDVARVAAAVPAALRAALERALSPRPEERYPSAAAMRDALHAFLVEQAPDYGERELVAELRKLIATAARHRDDMESSCEPVPPELRLRPARRHCRQVGEGALYSSTSKEMD